MNRDIEKLHHTVNKLLARTGTGGLHSAPSLAFVCVAVRLGQVRAPIPRALLPCAPAACACTPGCRAPVNREQPRPCVPCLPCVVQHVATRARRRRTPSPSSRASIMRRAGKTDANTAFLPPSRTTCPASPCRQLVAGAPTPRSRPPPPLPAPIPAIPRNPDAGEPLKWKPLDLRHLFPISMLVPVHQSAGEEAGHKPPAMAGGPALFVIRPLDNKVFNHLFLVSWLALI